MARNPRDYLNWRSTLVPGAHLYQWPRGTPRAAPGNPAPPAQPAQTDVASGEPPPKVAPEKIKPEPPLRPGDSADERRARSFLFGVMLRHPSGLPGRTKDDFERVCLKRFKITGRRFLAIRGDCIADTGATNWSKSGPRGSHKPKPRKPKPR
jgi:hypothetical protein